MKNIYIAIFLCATTFVFSVETQVAYVPAKFCLLISYLSMSFALGIILGEWAVIEDRKK